MKSVYGGNVPSLPHVGRNLATMVCRVHEHVRQDVAHRALKSFSLAVFVRYQAFERVCRFRRQELAPQAGKLTRLLIALLQPEFRPNWKGESACSIRARHKCSAAMMWAISFSGRSGNLPAARNDVITSRFAHPS